MMLKRITEIEASGIHNFLDIIFTIVHHEE